MRNIRNDQDNIQGQSGTLAQNNINGPINTMNNGSQPTQHHATNMATEFPQTTQYQGKYIL